LRNRTVSGEQESIHNTQTHAHAHAHTHARTHARTQHTKHTRTQNTHAGRHVHGHGPTRKDTYTRARNRSESGASEQTLPRTFARARTYEGRCRRAYAYTRTSTSSSDSVPSATRVVPLAYANGLSHRCRSVGRSVNNQPARSRASRARSRARPNSPSDV